jgi:hypothetical protein
VQIRTDKNGIVWARWIDMPAKPVPTMQPRSTASPAATCAHCGARDKSWTTVPDPKVMPRGELMYECKACGNTTREGRYTTESGGDDRAGFGGSRNTRPSN